LVMSCTERGGAGMQSDEAVAPAAFDFACEFCNQAFGSRNALFRHLRQQHEGAEVAKVAPPPSKQWEAERQAAPELHAKTAAAVKKPTVSDEPKEDRQLHLSTRPASYQKELSEKVGKMQSLMEGFSNNPLPKTEVFESPREHFRMRVEFDISHHDDGPKYVMHSGRERVVVQQYPMGSRQICDVLMPTVLKALNEELILRQQLFQVNFHGTLYGDAMVSLLYRTPYCRAERRQRMLAQGEAKQALGKEVEDGKLTDEWEEAAMRLSEALSGASVVGRVRGKKRVVGREWVEEHLQVAGSSAPLRYRQLEGFFSQSNPVVCQHMLAWARAVASDDDVAVGEIGPTRDDDLLELYCGNGNFCIALAPFFRRAFATELVRELLDLAQKNAEDNGVTNISFGRVSAEELALALSGSRTFNRLEHVDFTTFDFQTVLVDPPRAGLGPQIAAFIAQFTRIIYISCNPETVRDDLKVLSETHDIRRLAAFDQFAYTDHLEMGVLLVRRGASHD